MQENKKKVLIADDSEMNRSILADMLSEEYDIIEAENGIQAVDIISEHKNELSLLLLDIVMPEMNGFGVLEEMNERGWIDDLPVIMISSENKASNIERAYELGVTDFISRPFDALIVHRRVVNTILLYTKQKRLIDIAADQIHEKEEQSFLMVEILSHIVEFRNGESGRHVRRVRVLTDLMLKSLAKRSSYYKFTRAEIATISAVSALHDIGKIAIPETILNKPGSLTPEEFAVIKTHSMAGAKILQDLDIKNDSSRLVKTAYEICRWHHERYDGGGYPDGLRGDEIPISAQVVALCDVYDALTSDRVYKKAIPHEKAVDMILNGECGKFNPVVAECIKDIDENEVNKRVDGFDLTTEDVDVAHDVVEEILRRDNISASTRTLRLVEDERMKFDYFASLTNEIQFEYSVKNDTVEFSSYCTNHFDLPESVTDPVNNSELLSVISSEDIKNIFDMLKNSTPDDPSVRYTCELDMFGMRRWFRIHARSLWSDDDPAVLTGALGKAVDIHESVMQLQTLEKKASTDALTGLMNHASAKQIIKEKLSMGDNKKYALAIFDLDRFKQANDTYGHMFGDRVLMHTAQRLKKNMRPEDMTARVGGDEFLIFIEYRTDLHSIIKRIFEKIKCEYEGFNISLSMGIATTDVVGYDYERLFNAADKALYSAKWYDCGNFRFFDDSIRDVFSVISPIDY